jgi:AcrR family transcriptional regulator
VATKAIVEESGAESFTLREAARRAGVNHRAAYRHFEDKSALLAAVAEEGFVELSSRIEAALAREPEGASSRRLMAIARAYVEFASQNRGAYRVIGKNLDLVRHEIEQGIARGKLRKVDPLDTTLALWAATHGLSTLVLTRRVKVRPALVGELTERLLGDLLSGLAKKR